MSAVYCTVCLTCEVSFQETVVLLTHYMQSSLTASDYIAFCPLDLSLGSLLSFAGFRCACCMAMPTNSGLSSVRVTTRTLPDRLYAILLPSLLLLPSCCAVLCPTFEPATLNGGARGMNWGGGPLAREGCMVMDHKFKKGKLKGSDPLKNERMEALISEFREDIKAYGAGDQLVCVCLCVAHLVCVSGWVGRCSVTGKTRVHGRKNNNLRLVQYNSQPPWNGFFTSWTWTAIIS